jgi:hypothetical protein
MLGLICFLFSVSAHAAIISAPVAPSPLPSPVAERMAANQIKTGSNLLFQSNVRSATQLYNVIWNNVNGLSAQQVFTAIDSGGTPGDACQAHELYLGLAQLVNSAAPGTLPGDAATVTEAPAPVPSGSPSPCAITVSGQ